MGRKSAGSMVANVDFPLVLASQTSQSFLRTGTRCRRMSQKGQSSDGLVGLMALELSSLRRVSPSAVSRRVGGRRQSQAFALEQARSTNVLAG